MGRDSRPPCTKKYLPYLCKRFVSTMSKASHQAATSVSVLYIVGVCLTSYVTAQAPGPPRDSWNDPAAGGTQICDGQETGDRTRVSLPRHASVADDAQMSKLDTAQMQSDRVAEPATSSTSLGTEQQSLQCLRGHVDKESQEGSNSSSTAVANVPSGPLVTLSNGMLTVDPHNTSLGEVLGAISTTAGFQLDVPPLSMDGKVFDQTPPGQTATFPAGRLIPGWVEALRMMHEGDEWQLVIPADLAYGAQGAGNAIGPNQTLVFNMTLISVQPEAPPAP